MEAPVNEFSRRAVGRSATGTSTSPAYIAW